MLFLAGGKKRGKKEEEEGKKRRAMANVSLASRLVIFFFSSFLFFFLSPTIFVTTVSRFERYFPAVRFEVFLDGGKKRMEEGKKRKIIFDFIPFAFPFVPRVIVRYAIS